MFKGQLEDSVESIHRRRLLQQLDLAFTELTEAQQGVVSVIAGLMPAQDTPRPLDNLDVAHRPMVINLLNQLPQTREIERFRAGRPT